jgi:hypothetical protein
MHVTGSVVLTRPFLNPPLRNILFLIYFELLLHMARPMLTQKTDIFEKQTSYSRRQRINLNLLVDHSRELFMQNIHQFVKQESSLVICQSSVTSI